MKVVVIDDEFDGRRVIQKMLENFDDLEVAGVADSVKSGYDLIMQENPDLVFLDVEMPGGYGFDLLEKFSNIDFQVIFVTAYDQYAIKAIKFSALDYLLKPVNPQELQGAIEKARSSNPKGEIMQLLANLKSSLSSQKLAIPSVSSIKYVEIDKVIRFQAEGNYTDIFFTNASKITSTKILKEFEELLPEKHFLRVHRSHLINLTCVREFMKIGKDKVLMSDGTEIEVSRNRKHKFLEAMSTM